MGTRFELVLAGRRPERHRAAGEAALEEIESCHRRFTRFEDGGLLAHLRRVGNAVPLDRASYELFQDALTVWAASGGLFDLTLPVRRMTAIHLDPAHRTVRLADPTLPLDFGAIAKGHALDLAASVLRGAAVECAFLHGGTSSAVAIGTPPGTPGWRVAVSPHRAAPVVTLRDTALSASATATGNPHPTLDPRSGAPVAASRRAVVIGPSARLADAWSTVALVLGRRPAALDPAWSVSLFTDPAPCHLDAAS